jgi:hypothetical protein
MRVSFCSIGHGMVLCALVACGDANGPSPIVGDFTLTSVNGAPPPGLVGATVNCDQLIASGSLNLTGDRAFTLSGVVQLDCSRSGGSVENQLFTLNGSYTRDGDTVTFIIPGQGSLSAQYDGATLATTIPASPFTFPNDVALVFAVVEPLE